MSGTIQSSTHPDLRLGAIRTAGDVQEWIDYIARIAKQDPERAHGTENDLWREVLCAIALGSPDAKTLAQAALQSCDLEFPRRFTNT